MPQELFICKCNSLEHQIIFDFDEENKELFCSVHLFPLSFWKRFVHAIKYTFGYRCKYGDFEEIIIKPEDKERLLNLINKI